jgi:RND family efflux transporter MFP subunit
MFTFLVSCEKKVVNEPIRPVKAIQVKDSTPNDNQIIFPGTLRAFKRADLSFRIDGIVMIRDIFVGQRAKKGDILIQLDPREYEIAWNKAKGKVESLQAQLNFADRDYQRMKKIYENDPGAISVSLVDRKRETYNQLKAELMITLSDLDKAIDDLNYTSLRAPFDGIIAAIYVENHEQVHAKQPAIRFIDTAEREMEINVPEKYINTLIKEGINLDFKVYLDAFPKQVFLASIKEIGTEASSTTQTYPVTLAFKWVPIELSLLAGMSGKAVLQRPQPRFGMTTFKVPRSAIFTDNLKHTYVWVINPESQTVHKKAVRLEENDTGNFAIIQEGIVNGDWIITGGTPFLSEGQKVKFARELTSS